MEELMNRLGLSIPPVTGAPWWNTSCTDNKAETVVKEEVDEHDAKQVDYAPFIDYPLAKRQKRNCAQDHDDDDDNKVQTLPVSH